jgi:hypothetical protein
MASNAIADAGFEEGEAAAQRAMIGLADGADAASTASRPPAGQAGLGYAGPARRVGGRVTLGTHVATAGRRLLLAYLILGVPVQLAMDRLSDAVSSRVPLTLGALFIGTLLLNQIRAIRPKVFLAFYSFFGVLMLATLAAEPTTSRSQLISLAICAFWASPLITAYFLIRDERDYRFAMRLITLLGLAIVTSVALSAAGPRFLGFSFGEVSVDAGSIRAFGPLGDQVGFCLVFFAVLWFVKRRWVLGALAAATILFTGTRGAALSLGVGVLFLLWSGIRNNGGRSTSRRLGLQVTIAALCATMGFLATPWGAATLVRFQRIGVGSLQQRETSMALGWEVFKDHPLLGTGFLGFNHLGDLYHFTEVFGAGDVTHATYTVQNQLLQTAVDGGVPALLFLLAFLALLFQALRRSENQARIEDRPAVRACATFLVALGAGDQGAVWLLPASITAYVLLLASGISLRAPASH